MPMLNLPLGAAARLAQLCSTTGLLHDQAKLYRIGEFNENYLSDLKPSPVRPDAKASTEQWAEWDGQSKRWVREQLPPIEVKERTRDALRELVTSAIDKGQMSGSLSDTLLMRALGLSPED